MKPVIKKGKKKPAPKSKKNLSMLKALITSEKGAY